MSYVSTGILKFLTNSLLPPAVAQGVPWRRGVVDFVGEIEAGVLAFELVYKGKSWVMR
jgi:hypothetical protein